MSVQFEKLEGNMGKMTIEVPAEEVSKALEAAYNKNRGKINVPGFRKGKAPRKMIESMYGPQVFYEDAADAMINEAYAKAYDECEEEIVSNPTIDVVQLEEGKPFIFTAEFALKPAVKLGKYKGVKVEAPDATVTDEDVQAALEKELENNARLIPVTDRAVAQGDTVSLDFEGYVDGVAFEGGKGENYDLEIGSGSFIPGFEEQLVGAEIDQPIDVVVTFPEDYHAEDLAGKEAVFKCLVHDIKVKEIPALDDDFAAEVSEFDTLEEYKADVRTKLEEKKAKEAKQAKEDAVVDAVSEASEIDIPEAMIVSQQRRMAEDYAQRLQYQGLSIEQYFQYTGLTREKFFEQLKPRAVEQIRTRLTLEAIVEAEKIEVTDEELEDELKQIAEAYQMELDKIKEMIGEAEIKSIRGDIAVRKAVEFIVANAK